MKFLLFLPLLAISAFSNAQEKLPNWLMPDSSGHQVYVRGTTSFKGDPSMKSATIEIYCLNDGTRHKFFSDENGFFEFFAQENKEYDVVFTKGGYVTKAVRLDTKGVPGTSWEKGLVVELDVDMMKMGPTTPADEHSIAWCWYNPEKKKFGFAQHDDDWGSRAMMRK